jgi:hypothetical protein
MKRAADVPWVDVVLARINPGKIAMDGTVDDVVQVLRDIKAKGKAVIGMKIFGEGKLAGDPGKREECMKFAQGLGLIDAMTIGSVTTDQMDENLALLEKFPAAKVG